MFDSRPWQKQAKAAKVKSGISIRFRTVGFLLIPFWLSKTLALDLRDLSLGGILIILVRGTFVMLLGSHQANLLLGSGSLALRRLARAATALTTSERRLAADKYTPEADDKGADHHANASFRISGS